MAKQYIHMPIILDQAQSLNARGGGYQRAVNQVLAIITNITKGVEDPFVGISTTNHGETRLKNCIKYDLSKFCRLVTVHEKNKIFLLFFGTHDDVDKWLDRNRGCLVAEKNGMIEIISGYSNHGNSHVAIETKFSQGKLYEQLSKRYFDFLIEKFPESIIEEIKTLHCFSDDSDIQHIHADLQGIDRADCFFDVFIELKAGNKDAAVKRLDYEKGDYRQITEKPVTSGEQLYVIPDNDPQYAQLFEHFVKTADYKQWMLFMHPEQERCVDVDFSASSKLLGVSGSGKTCVLVKRAVRLANKYPSEKVLVVTLNRSLANLIKELVDVVAVGDTASRIDVRPFFSVCQEYLHEFEPESDRIYSDVTWKSLEHIDEVWEEFYCCENNNHDASVLHSIHDSLIAQGINARNYIREEFDWIRSAIPCTNRDAYLTIKREGRSVPLQESQRRQVLDGLAAWEKKMKDVGITDYLGLASALYKHLDKLTPKYRSTLVDESQDFGTTELSILRRITLEGENDVFLCGDAAQRVSTKFQSFKDAGLNIPTSNTKKITKNYRNTKEILETAYMVLSSNIPEGASTTEDLEILDPDFSSRSGSTPILAVSDSLKNELGSALAYAKQETRHNLSWKACIAICGFTAYEVQKYGEEISIPVLDNNAKIGEASIFLSDLEQTKGFEFDLMIIVNASQDVIPARNSPEREYFRDLTQFYVALTRAKNQLVVSYNNVKSLFLNSSDINGCFLECQWEEYIEEEVADVSIPRFVKDFREDNNVSSSLFSLMSGKQFLYTDEAMSIPQPLIEKLRALITGEAKVRDKSYVQWRNIGSAFDSCVNDVKSRRVFGPEGYKLFRELCDHLNIEDEIRKFKKDEIYGRKPRLGLSKS
ncbi:MAG TPA: 3'-5' exonuclease [Pseudomonadales bacterium]|jgi:hypothetical protein|nr:3'-5' exonuclease [Pseudomonadales bacterium]HNN86130.1 3'-5' exonuclease [Pseudomonadales bacterium]